MRAKKLITYACASVVFCATEIISASSSSSAAATAMGATRTYSTQEITELRQGIELFGAVGLYDAIEKRGEDPQRALKQLQIWDKKDEIRDLLVMQIVESLRNKKVHLFSV